MHSSLPIFAKKKDLRKRRINDLREVSRSNDEGLEVSQLRVILGLLLQALEL
jgi:hypothetical protein